jgi:DNA-directed RNA polymerase subunit RPC12/RpoP
MGRMPTCSKCGKAYRNYMGPLLGEFTRKGLHGITVTKEIRCEGCGHLLGHKTWKYGK